MTGRRSYNGLADIRDGESMIIQAIREKEKINKLCINIQNHPPHNITELDFLASRLNMISGMIDDTTETISEIIESIMGLNEDTPAICNDCIQAMEEDARKCRETIGDD